MSTPKYTKETLERAISLVKSQAMNQLTASRAFGIPQSTLNDKILAKSPMVKKRKTVLTEEEEEKLASWIIEMAKRGFGRTKEDIQDVVKTILDKRGATTVFRDYRPGKDWMAAFLLRHKAISERMPQALGKERAMVSAGSLLKWFEELRAYVDTMDPTLLGHPHRIFNADESGFNICPKTKKVLAPAGAKHVYQLTSSSRTQITVLACSSAAGQYLPPLLIFPYQRNPKFNPLEGFEQAFFQRTKNGWISTEVFLTWIRDIFIPVVEDKPKPVLLFVDGHSSHVTSVDICELCQEKGVLLYCLRPHSSHITQPLDQAYFGALKRAWSEAVRKHILATGEVVTLPTFARVLSEAWKIAARPEIAFSGFARAGLFPFDPSVVVNSGKLKVADNFVPPSDTPESTEITPELTERDTSFSKKLRLFEDLVGMGSKTNLRNIVRIREGYDVEDPDFSRWRDLLLDMFGTPTSSVSEPPATLALQRFRPTTPQVEPLPSASPLSMEPVPSTSRIESPAPFIESSVSTSGIEPMTIRNGEPTTSGIHSSSSSSSVIDEVLVLPKVVNKNNTNIPKKDTCRTMALSSDEYITILKSKEDKKKEIKEAKKQRKIEREEKKKQKEEMGKEKKENERWRRRESVKKGKKRKSKKAKDEVKKG